MREKECAHVSIILVIVAHSRRTRILSYVAYSYAMYEYLQTTERILRLGTAYSLREKTNGDRR